jgi:hypothetical protein
LALAVSFGQRGDPELRLRLRSSGISDQNFLLATQTPLSVIARATTNSAETLRAQCEVREANHLASDLRIALDHRDARPRMAADRLRALEELIVGRYWWRHTR